MEEDKGKCRISIIVPVFNTPNELLLRCFESIQKQTFQNFELIVVDDGSENECSSFLQHNESKYGYRLFRRTNSGVSAARNFGIEQSRGEFIMFADADDFLEEDCLSRAVRAADQNEADVVLGGINLIRGSTITRYVISLDEPAVYTGEAIQKLQRYMIAVHSEKDAQELKRLRFSGPWGKLIRKDVLGAVRFDVDLPVYEDLIFNVAVFDKALKVVIDNAVWYNYIIYNNSAMHKYRADGIREQMAVINRLWQLNGEAGKSFTAAVSIKTITCLKHIFRHTIFHKLSSIEHKYAVARSILCEPLVLTILKQVDLKNYIDIGLKEKVIFFLFRKRLAFILAVLYSIKGMQ